MGKGTSSVHEMITQGKWEEEKVSGEQVGVRDGGEGEAASGPEGRRAGIAGDHRVAGSAEIDHGAGSPLDKLTTGPFGRLRTGLRGHRDDGARGRGTEVGRDFGCVQSMRAMCSVSGPMCSLFG